MNLFSSELRAAPFAFANSPITNALALALAQYRAARVPSPSWACGREHGRKPSENFRVSLVISGQSVGRDCHATTGPRLTRERAGLTH
jgi:hypothetical protein